MNTFLLRCKCVHLSIKKNRNKFLRLRIKHFSFKNAELNNLRFFRILKTLKELLWKAMTSLWLPFYVWSFLSLQIRHKITNMRAAPAHYPSSTQASIVQTRPLCNLRPFIIEWQIVICSWTLVMWPAGQWDLCGKCHSMWRNVQRPLNVQQLIWLHHYRIESLKESLKLCNFWMGVFFHSNISVRSFVWALRRPCHSRSYEI